MRVLLDTHVFLWWITDDPRLTVRARAVIGDGKNTIFFSAASAWEIAIKARLGKLKAPGDLRAFIAEQLALNNITPLPVRLSHALYVYVLPDYHRDPFDRLLVAQAQIENLLLLTSDLQIAKYAVEIIW